MSLGADLAAALPGLRAEAESMMLSTGIVWRATGNTVIDPDTFEETAEMVSVYEGRGRLKLPNSLAVNPSAVPGTVVTGVESYLSLPVNDASAGVRAGDIWETTANPLDPDLVGQRVRITRPHAQTYATARRFPVTADV